MEQTIKIKWIADRIGLQASSVNAAGHSINDELNLPDAIQFVQARTVAAGRWTSDKADKAKILLSELEGMKIAPKSDADSPAQSNCKAVEVPSIRPAVVSFTPPVISFAPAIVSAPALPPATNETSKADNQEQSGSDVFMFMLGSISTVHCILLAYDLYQTYSIPGLILAAIYTLFMVATIGLALKPELNSTSSNATTVYTIATLAAWWIHFNAFKDELSYNSSISTTENQYTAGVLALFAVVIAISAMWIMRSIKIENWINQE